VFKDKLAIHVKHYNKILIAADYGSTGLVLYFTLFNYFRKKQQKKGLSSIRPNIYLLDGIKRFFQIMTYNKTSIHPYLQRLIKKDYNPFQSAIIKWIKGYKDLERALHKKGGIFILPDSSLRQKFIQIALKEISEYKYNLIYLCGPIRNKNAIELASGTDRIKFDDIEINNKAIIWNREYPNIELNLHADKIQLFKLLEKINPSHICFFHQKPRELAKVRADLLKNFTDIKTSAIYKNQESDIILYDK
jgi:predicted metal-dependent RNase